MQFVGIAVYVRAMRGLGQSSEPMGNARGMSDDLVMLRNVRLSGVCHW